jgi:hypothetical protein
VRTVAGKLQQVTDDESKTRSTCARAAYCDAMKKRIPLIVLLALPGFGFTDCQYFAPVSVQLRESTPPVVGTRMWVDGRESIRTGDSLTYTTTGDVIVAPFVFDAGGARTLSLQSQRVEIFCHNSDIDPEESQVTDIILFDKSDSQPAASAGEKRSNGLYVVSAISDLSSYADYCYSGFDVVDVSYSWVVVGRDYAGNQAAASGAIVWAP